jgi:peptidoglycan/xylan/chitin deacetylase (PgdA/CDA1 family)
VPRTLSLTFDDGPDATWTPLQILQQLQRCHPAATFFTVGERVLALLDLGGAVLMHYAPGPGVRRAGCQNTLALLPRLAAAVRAHRLLAPMGYRASQCSPSNAA